MTATDCSRNLRVMYIFTVLLNSIFILPVILPFYRDEMGLTFHDFLIGESFFAVMVILALLVKAIALKRSQVAL